MYEMEKKAFDFLISQGFVPEEGKRGLGWAQMPEDGPTSSEVMSAITFLMREYGYGPLYRKSFPSPPEWTGLTKKKPTPP